MHFLAGEPITSGQGNGPSEQKESGKFWISPKISPEPRILLRIAEIPRAVALPIPPEDGGQHHPLPRPPRVVGGVA